MQQVTLAVNSCKNIIQRSLSFIQASEIGIKGEKNHMNSGDVSFPSL